MKKFIFLSFWTIDFDAVLDKLFTNLFALTNLNEVCNFNVKNSNKHIWIQKISLFKMANSPDVNVRVEKRSYKNWSKMCWFSFQKIDLLFDHWNPGPNRPTLWDMRGQNILPVINAIKRRGYQECGRSLCLHLCTLLSSVTLFFGHWNFEFYML